jgi:hypothetical protein
MDTQQVLKLLLARMESAQVKADANRKEDKEEMVKEMRANQEKADIMLAKLDANQAKADADRVQMQEMMKMMQANQTNTDAKLESLSDRIEKTQMALQTAEMCRDTTTKGLKEDLTKTYKETCKRIEETKREFQARLDETRQTRAEGANTAGVGTCSAQSQTFNGDTTWSVFRRQFEVVVEHNRWSNQDKSTYLIIALKGRAADVLPGIPTNTTYEDTLRALEDRFGDQHFAAAYCCQLTSRRQNPEESLQGFATAIEMLALRAYPNLPADYVAREAGKAFAYGIRDTDIKIQLLLGGEKTVNEALRQALELQAVLVAARPYENNANTQRKYRSFPTQKLRRWNCRGPGHFE